jgi:hypothetical protein
MNNKQENKLSMYNAVREIVTTNTSLWEKIPAFTAAFTEYGTLLDNIAATLRTQNSDLTGASADKVSGKEALANATLAVAGAIHAYASQSNKAELKQRVALTRSDLLLVRDMEMLEKCRTIASHAEANKASIADYGATEAVIKDLQDKITAFATLAVRPRVVIAERKDATADLQNLIRLTDTLLSDRLDKIMEQFKVTQPGFYNLYQTNRILVDSGVRRQPSPAPAPTPQA